jgi:hypothetical protein
MGESKENVIGGIGRPRFLKGFIKSDEVTTQHNPELKNFSQRESPLTEQKQQNASEESLESFVWKVEFTDVDKARVFCADPELRSVITSLLEDIGSWMWSFYNLFKNTENVKIVQNSEGLFTFIRVR